MPDVPVLDSTRSSSGSALTVRLGGVVTTATEAPRARDWAEFIQGLQIGPRDVPLLTTRPLSPHFLQRIHQFADGLDGWDGDTILLPTVARASRIAETTLQVAPEPFTAPAMDGSILLKWDFSPSLSAEIYIEEPESWDTATVIDSGVVREVPIADEDALLALLAELSLSHAGN